MKQNRNNRVNNKNHSGKNEFRIVNLLPCGQENAISTQDLMKLSGYDTARDLQQQIAWSVIMEQLSVAEAVKDIGSQRIEKKLCNFVKLWKHEHEI